MNTSLIPDWKVLDKNTPLEKLDQLSHNKAIAIFKHSTRCGMSCKVKKALEEKWDINSTEVDFYYLDLLNLRSISDQIASRYNIEHQSPQLIIISRP